MAVDDAAPAPVSQRCALIVCMFLITATNGFIQPFVPLYLAASRLDKGQIGLVSGLGAGMALLVQPLIGRFSDHIDSRRPLMVVAAVLSAFSYLAYRNANGAVAFILLTALGMNGVFYLNAVCAVLIGRMVGAGRGGAAYAGYRVWGSVGYIFVSLATGFLLMRVPAGHSLDRQNLTPVFTYGPLLFFAIAVTALFVPDRKNDPIATRLLPAADNGRAHMPLNVRRFLLAFFLYQFSLYGASAYLSLFLKALHASPLWITSVFAAGVVSEVLVMRQVGRISDRYGRRPPLAIAFALMPVRLLFYIPATGPLWVLLVQTLHGFNFGIMGAIAIAFINDTAHDRERGAAQARLAAVQGLAIALGPAACGVIAQTWGIGWMFAAMSAVGAAGAAVFLLGVGESLAAPVRLGDGGPSALRPLLRLLAYPPDDPARSRR